MNAFGLIDNEIIPISEKDYDYICKQIANFARNNESYEKGKLNKYIFRKVESKNEQSIFESVRFI